jgi:hypothetical protein
VTFIFFKLSKNPLSSELEKEDDGNADSLDCNTVSDMLLFALFIYNKKEYIIFYYKFA